MQGKVAIPVRKERRVNAANAHHTTGNLLIQSPVTPSRLEGGSSTRMSFTDWWGNSLTIRTKTFLIIVTALLVFLLIVVLPIRTLLLNSFTSLENEQAITDYDRADKALNLQIDSIARIARDYASSDETYNFIENPSSDYLQTTIPKQVMQNFHLNVVAVYDLQGDLLYKGSYDYINATSRDLPDYFKRPGMAQDALLKYSDEWASNRGIIMVSNMPMMVVSFPILTNDSKGPSRGWFVMGRYLGQDSIDRLSATTHLDISFRDYASLTAEQVTAAPKGAKLHVGPVDDNTISAAGVLPSLYGEPALLMTITEPRTIYNHGRDVVSFLVLVLVCAVIAMVILALILVERVLL
ncbi:MAG: CHASE4 domain-containing protein, partial [Chloroflexia bacterium]